MTDRSVELTRRKILGSVGAVGVAGAGAGIGTSALFSDEESFSDNSIEAGELNLVVDYYTSHDQGSFGSDSQSGTVDGDGATEYSYSVGDVKPGDSGTLAFCPKVVDNPGYVSVSSGGVTDFENGHTEPEGDIDDDIPPNHPNPPDLGSPNNGTSDGAGYGELSEAIEVTVSYAGSVSHDSGNDEVTCNNTRELDNPQGYTLGDLVTDLGYGVPLDGNEPNDGDGTIDAYPGSSGPGDQQGPCLCIEWEVPTDVGNEIQSDGLELDFTFAAEQARNNDAPATVLYNDLYNHFNGASTVEFEQRLPGGNTGFGPTATWAYTRNGLSFEFTGRGGIVGLGSSGAGPFELTSGAVIMSNYYGWDVESNATSGGPGLGQSTPGYSHDFTLELYEVDRSGPYPEPVTDQNGDPDPFAEITETQDVPGREVPDGSNGGYADIGGTNFLMEWDLGGVTVNSDELLFMVSFVRPETESKTKASKIADLSNFDVVGQNHPDFKPLALDMLNIVNHWSLDPDPTAGYDDDTVVGEMDGVWWRTDNDFTYFPLPQRGQVMSRFEGRPI